MSVLNNEGLNYFSQQISSIFAKASVVTDLSNTISSLSQTLSSLNNTVSNKVDKISGQGLSTNDYTTAEKNKLAGIAEGANKYTLPTANSSNLGGVKTGDAIADITGYTPVHIKDGIIYYYDTNTHYRTRLYAGASETAANAVATDPYLKVTDDDTFRNQVQFKGSGTTTVSSDANGIITIDSTDSKVTQTYSTTNNTYPLLFSATSGTTSTASRGATTAIVNNAIYANPSGGILFATSFIGSGAGLTDLNANNITGTLAKERLATSGVTAASYGPSSNASPAHNGTFSVPYITVDTYGRVTAASTKTITLPAYSTATTSADGLMTAAMVTKLNGIATGANAYTLPAATASVLGGVIIGSNITVSSGTISLTKDNIIAALGYTPSTSNTITAIEQGGTGATTASAALTNLGGVGYTIVSDISSLL